MGFYLKKALQDILDNRLLNIVAIITISLSILIISAFGLFFINADEIINSWKKGIRIMAYLEPGVHSSKIGPLKEKIETMYGIQSVHFISKEDALKRLKALMQRQSGLLDNLKENPLPNAFEILLLPVTGTEDHLENMARQIESLEDIDDVEYGQHWMDRVSSFLSLFRFAGLAMGGLFFMATIFIVANTIRLVLYSRREEIDIMRLVGATDRFIKAPFYIEGLIQGFSGAMIGLGILFVTYSIANANLNELAWSANFRMKFFSPEYTLFITFASMMMGLIGCYLSLKQFLKN